MTQVRTPVCPYVGVDRVIAYVEQQLEFLEVVIAGLQKVERYTAAVLMKADLPPQDQKTVANLSTHARETRESMERAAIDCVAQRQQMIEARAIFESDQPSARG